MMGRSGGGFVCTGAAMLLATRNESNICKLVVSVVPMTGNQFFTVPFDDLNMPEQSA
eukprot:CAMPEP_0116984944 /NCGR_PEP_ID=MMETSP0467-20121206/61938_1 /TAXON_ID=283647 /ORGANISM="Mesodinium pulex, Strain SPMC105" /LENGTH=56 /DNA_ID=CAMNT_0004680121 /DNA_START=526 /DNA_END=696 /DNA_ORIENTATION=-